jgi:hypothetical protein
MNLDQTFLLRPDNRAFLLGQTDRLAGTPPVGCVVMPLVGVIVSLACFWGGHHARKVRQASLERQAAAVGTVLERRTQSSVGMIDLETGGVDSSEDHLVRYRFEDAGGRTLEREGSVSEAEYGRLTVGSPVTVIYDAADPASSRLLTESDPDLFSVLVASGGVGSLASILFGLLLATDARRRRRLVRDGTLLEGKVLTCTSAKNEDNVVKIDVTYAFTTPKGRAVQATATTSHDGSKEPPLPQVGETLAVLYVDESTYEAL